MRINCIHVNIKEETFHVVVISKLVKKKYKKFQLIYAKRFAEVKKILINKNCSYRRH